MLEFRICVTVTAFSGLLIGCATAKAPICDDSNLYVPVKRQHPQAASRPGWVAVGLEVGSDGGVNRTFVIAEDAPQSFTSNALRILKRWKYCQLPGPDAGERVTHACVFSATNSKSLAQLQEACSRAAPNEFGYLR